MAKTIVSLAMSLDGFIAGPNDGQDNPLGDGGSRLFDLFNSGDTPIPQYEEAGVPVPSFRMSKPSAEVFSESIDSGGAIITGRRTYDISHAWGGNGPVPGIPVFVLTHNPPAERPPGLSEYTYVTDGVENAIEQAKAVAGDKYVGLMGSAAPQQALRAGLLDEIQVHVVPVLLGSGVRLFDNLTDGIDLELLRVVDAPGVTHLRYRVRR